MSKSAEQVRTHYDQYAAQYRDFAEASFSWLYIEKPALDRLLRPVLSSESRVLDIGCGVGRGIHYLHQLGVHNITGVDLSSRSIAQAREVFPQAHLLQGNITEGQLFQRDSFDAILASMLFEHFDEEELTRSLTHCGKILRKGGLLCYLTTHPARFFEREAPEYVGWKSIKTPWGTKMPFFQRNLSSFINSTLAAGFSIQKIDECDINGVGYTANTEEYRKYLSYKHSRLAVLAMKN